MEGIPRNWVFAGALVKKVPSRSALFLGTLSEVEPLLQPRGHLESVRGAYAAENLDSASPISAPFHAPQSRAGASAACRDDTLAPPGGHSQSGASTTFQFPPKHRLAGFLLLARLWSHPPIRFPIFWIQQKYTLEDEREKVTRKPNRLLKMWQLFIYYSLQIR